MKAPDRQVPFLLLTVAGVAGCLALAFLGREGQQHQADRQALAQHTLELDYQGETALRRIRAKNKVMNRLVAGELTLFETAAWFRFFGGVQPAARDDARIFLDETDEEKMCRQVIYWVVEDFMHLHLEGAEAACDAQPAVCQPGGPQALPPQQPLLLPDPARACQDPAQRPQEAAGKPESIMGLVYKALPVADMSATGRAFRFSGQAASWATVLEGLVVGQPS